MMHHERMTRHAAPATAPLVMSCGEPAGVGPELAVMARAALGADIPFAWLGDPTHLPGGTAFQEIRAPHEAHAVPPHLLPVLAHRFAAPARPAHPNPAHASDVIAVIARAVRLVQNGEAAALVTAPINKKALKEGAGFAFPGHTEYLANLAGGDGLRPVMMLACRELRVVPATIHIPLNEVAAQLTETLLEDTIRITHHALQEQFALAAPRLAVAGLNPHAGEGGLMGDEEIRFIAPLIARLRAEGMDIRGPLPADTLFHARARAGYDAAICAYHDQALIPIKTLDFDGGVNITLGLPFIRTSPDHGTAFDIAGRGLARPQSMINACRMAWNMAQAQSRSAANCALSNRAAEHST